MKAAHTRSFPRRPGNSFPVRRREGEEGLALLTVVALLAVMSIMAIAFTLSVRNEEQAVRNYVHTALVHDVSLAGTGVARSYLASTVNGPDGKPNSGDETILVDSLEEPWAIGFADVLGHVEGLRLVYDTRRYLFRVDPATSWDISSLREVYAGLNRPFDLGVDEDPYGDRDGLLDSFGDPQPGLPGVDDDGDGGIDRMDPEVRAAINSRAPYIPEFDDDEDGLMDEDGPDYNFNGTFAVGLGIDTDGDRTGVFDESSKIDLNFTGNLVAQGSFRHMYNDGVTSFEINPAMLFYDRLLNITGNIEDPDGRLVYSALDASALGSAMVGYRHGAEVTGSEQPGAPGVDDNFNSNALKTDLVRVGDGSDDSELPVRGNLGDGLDTNNDGVADDTREYPLSIDGVDNDGDGLTDEPDEGVDEPFEFTNRPPDLIRGGKFSDDRPFETPESSKLADEGRLGRDIWLNLDTDPGDGFVNTFAPTTSAAVEAEFSRRRTTPYIFVKDYLTVFSTASQEMTGRGFARDRINPNFTSNLVAQLTRQPMDYVFPIVIDNDGDWNRLRDDHNGNGFPDGDWDGLPETGLVQVHPIQGLVDGPAADGIDNDGDGLIDNIKENDPPSPSGNTYDAAALYDDGDINRDGISNYDPEWHVNEDPYGDANGDGRPGIGLNNPLLLRLVNEGVLTEFDLEQLADDDGDGGWDLGEAFGSDVPNENNADPEVWAAWTEPETDGIDNNWNSPVWLNDGVDNDGDGRTDERWFEDEDGKDEGVDETGEWYIPAFDDDEDGRMDEDPPEFEFLFNLVDSIDRPIPTYDDMELSPEERVNVVMAPDAPQLARSIPRYSIFHVRDPLVSSKGDYIRVEGNPDATVTGHLDRLQAIRKKLNEDPDGVFATAYEGKPKVAYEGGEAIRINEVMGAPLIRVWQDDSDLLALSPNLPGDNSDDVFPSGVGVPPLCSGPPPACDGTWPALDDHWHLYQGEEDDPLNGKLWIVHNYPDIDPVSDPLCGIFHGAVSETLDMTVSGIPQGNYQARYVPYPLQANDDLANINALGPCGRKGLQTQVGTTAGEIEIIDAGGAPRVVGIDAESLGAEPGTIHRIIDLGVIEVDDTNSFDLSVVIYPWALGTFGFSYIELFDPDQQYVELINITKGARPVVLNGEGDDPERAWHLHIDHAEEGEKVLRLQGAVYSNDDPNPMDIGSRHENISLVMVNGATEAGPIGDAQDTIRANYGLDDTEYPDRPDTIGNIEPMGTGAQPFQNLFLNAAPEEDVAADEIHIFSADDLFSAEESPGELRMGGRQEATIWLTAPKDPGNSLSSRFVVDRVRVVADTRGEAYRGFQSSERSDPYSGMYEFGTTVVDGEEQQVFGRNRQFARLYARDALAVRNRLLESPDPPDPGEGLRPGDPWEFVEDPTDILGGYFASPECSGDPGYETGTWRWVLDGVIEPSAEWIDIRVFGRQEYQNGRLLEPSVIGNVTATIYDLETLAVVDTDGAANLGDGMVAASHLRVNPDDPAKSRRVLELEVTNALWRSDYSELVCVSNLPGVTQCTFSYIEISTAGAMNPFDLVDQDDEPDPYPVLGGTAGRPNGTFSYSPNHAEHWDGMMPNIGRTAFISTGPAFRTPTLEETAQVARQVTTYHKKDIQGLISLNTAQRPVLLCLPWAQPPADRISDAETFDRMFGFANLMTLIVINARQENGGSGGGFSGPSARLPFVDDDGDGFVDEGPYQSVGDFARALRALRWVAGTTEPLDPPVFGSWINFRGTVTSPDMLQDEFIQLFNDQTITASDITGDWIARLEKEIFARISNLVTVRSNEFELVTRGRVLTDDGQVMAESTTTQIVDRRF